jgi:hypothetical protein
MGYMCGCQLPQKPEEYVWAKCLDDCSEEPYIYIAPKNDFHWDGGLQHIIGHLIPPELGEACESMFDYTETDDNKIEDIMAKSGMVYSEELFNVVQHYDNTVCVCLACTNVNAFERIEFVKAGQEKCPFGCFHVVVNKS